MVMLNFLIDSSSETTVMDTVAVMNTWEGPSSVLEPGIWPLVSYFRIFGIAAPLGFFLRIWLPLWMDHQRTADGHGIGFFPSPDC
jgi:hypothetical protein